MSSFDPEHKSFVVPKGAKPGDTEKISLPDGRICKYILPRGSKPGETHVIRADQGMKKILLRLEKKEASSRLGIILVKLSNEKHLVCQRVDSEGIAAGVVLPGDIMLSLSADLPVAKAIEAKSLPATADLLQTAVGLVRIEVMRPTPAPPTRVLHSGFMFKRSPKSLIGVHAWQNRWFELSPVR